MIPFYMTSERVKHTTISNSEIILWNEWFSVIRVNDTYIFQWADPDLRR